MIPVCTVREMREADAAAIAMVGSETLIARAGYAVGRVVASYAGYTYGLRVVVILGSGNNAEDGRVAGRYLSERGAHVDYVTLPCEDIVLADVVIDAVVGLGASRPVMMPRVPDDALVVAVDVPSGVDCDSGEVHGEVLRADVTVALGALKFAHLLEPAAGYCGDVLLDTLDIESSPTTYVIEDSDLEGVIATQRDDHKWQHALFVAAGSTLMPGAAALVCRAAAVCGASMIRLASASPLSADHPLPDEVVRAEGPAIDERCAAVVVGPGVGRDDEALAFAREVIRSARVPLVIDADALDRDHLVARHVGVPCVVTPHAGEMARLIEGGTSSPLSDTRTLARECDVVALRKGPLTIVADPSGATRMIISGTPALASAGTGDVLSGVIGALLARGLQPLEAAALGAHLHGVAGQLLDPYATASEMDHALRQVLAELHHAS